MCLGFVGKMVWFVSKMILFLMNQYHTYYPAQFFLAVISMRKGIETNEAICDMIEQALNEDTPLQVTNFKKIKKPMRHSFKSLDTNSKE